MTSATTSIPLIDLQERDKDTLVAKLRQACGQTGFFYLTGHGLSKGFLEQVLGQTKAVFDLDDSTKNTLSDFQLSRGYTPMQEETLDPVHQTMGDTKEGYYIGREIPITDPRYNPAKFYGPNVWPRAEDCPGFRE